MSLAQFDELYDICCEKEEEEVKHEVETMEAKKNLEKDPNNPNGWWEEAVKDIVEEEEYELFYA